MKKYTKEEFILIWLDSFLGLEYKHKYAMLDMVKESKTIPQFISVAKNYIISAVGEKEYNTIFSSSNEEYFKFILDELNKLDITMITILSSDYPESLKNISNPPLVLYCKGDTTLLNSKCFSIVGTRKCSPLSTNITNDFATKISNAGFTIVSGIAEGADVTAIKGALSVNGKVISVIAGGFNNIYPKEHINIFNEIVKKGLVISEQTPSTPAFAYLFPIRNRIIAGLSQGVLVTTAGEKSGALYTAQFAGEAGRDIFAIPYSIGIKGGVGTNNLIKNGAILTDTPNDILDFYGISKNEEKQDIYSDKEKQILDALEYVSHVEKIAEKTNLSVNDILVTLSLLEIKGKVIKNGANLYSLCK